MPVEYRVRPVTRHIVTRYEDGVGSTQIGEYPSAEVAHSVGHALCDAERIKAGEPLDSPAFVYPGVVRDEPVTLTVDVSGAVGNAEVKRMVAAGVKQGMQQIRAEMKPREPRA